MKAVLDKSEKKKVRISSKRQFTIPKQFFSELGFDKEAICMIEGNKLVIIPVADVSGGEFAEQILAELISEGITGEELLAEFKRRQRLVRPAVERMLDAAKDAALGKGEFMTYEDVFGGEE